MFEYRREPDWDRLKALCENFVTVNREMYGASYFRWPISCAGPLMALISVGTDDWELSWRQRFAAWVSLRILRRLIEQRPAWNDFLIIRWALTGEEWAAEELIDQLEEPGPIGDSAAWALGSLCEQRHEFAERFFDHLPCTVRAFRTPARSPVKEGAD